MEAARPGAVNIVVLLGARPKVSEILDGGLPRELINVSGKCVLHWLLEALQTKRMTASTLCTMRRLRSARRSRQR